jgi:hypothetical protein
METTMSDEDQKMLVDFVRACADKHGASDIDIEREFTQIVNGARLIVWGLENSAGDARVD